MFNLIISYDEINEYSHISFLFIYLLYFFLKINLTLQSFIFYIYTGLC